ncbi:Endoribonuclease YbeY [Candidatus Cyrtobacter comes]|uniref:Endoribonuclease YbeY n=1 Tax=Candidatus Cyrtobacter comes TaxID=675776 RepID=A0ABU5L8T4_9RICK|nr:rRNA maturation RNase YbeY [Candidatus Cyrtobacter comes]MDZ5762525.1 Endoribonuclease YbeY [Candidatus Cyrtobacter comes]
MDSDSFCSSAFPVVELSIDSPSWLCSVCFANQHQIELQIKLLAEAVAKRLKLKPNFRISVLLSDDERLRQLNKEFRGKDKPTNVLSFPSSSELRATMGGDFIGDIALSYERVSCESIEFLKSFKEYFSHMIVHSILHLFGYDHVLNEEAKLMEQLESDIMISLGFSCPYSSVKVDGAVLADNIDNHA